MDVFFRIQGQQFVWDADKAATNISKHGIRFETACEVFIDPFVREVDASVDEESRDAAIGSTLDLTLLFVVHVIWENDWIRIISARPATRQERRHYETYQ